MTLKPSKNSKPTHKNTTIQKHHKSSKKIKNTPQNSLKLLKTKLQGVPQWVVGDLAP
jgi:hypothetical protein